MKIFLCTLLFVAAGILLWTLCRVGGEIDGIDEGEAK